MDRDKNVEIGRPWKRVTSVNIRPKMDVDERWWTLMDAISPRLALLFCFFFCFYSFADRRSQPTRLGSARKSTSTLLYTPLRILYNPPTIPVRIIPARRCSYINSLWLFRLLPVYLYQSDDRVTSGIFRTQLCVKTRIRYLGVRRLYERLELKLRGEKSRLNFDIGETKREREKKRN